MQRIDKGKWDILNDLDRPPAVEEARQAWLAGEPLGRGYAGLATWWAWRLGREQELPSYWLMATMPHPRTRVRGIVTRSRPAPTLYGWSGCMDPESHLSGCDCEGRRTRRRILRERRKAGWYDYPAKGILPTAREDEIMPPPRGGGVVPVVRKWELP